MASPSTANVTVTSTTGPGVTVTALVINGVLQVVFDLVRNMIFITDSAGRIREFAYDAVATLTWTISGRTATVAIS